MNEREAERGSRAPRLRVLGIAVAAAVVLGAAVALPLLATATPDFFARYHLLERRYVNLEGSAHEGIGCRSCHETQPVANGLSLIADFYTSLVESSALPANFKFAPPMNRTCLSCHADEWSSDASRTARIPHPAHQRVSDETRECVSCHKWTAHFESYLVKHETMPFSGVCVAYGCHVGTKATEQCFDCHHVLHQDAEQWKIAHPAVARATGQNPCLESCHTVTQCQECHTTGKTPKFDGLPIEVGMKAIEELHVRPEWTARYHGEEALKDPPTCLRCHETTGECDECHRLRPAFHGSTATWLGRHQKHSDTVDDPRCLTCHQKAWCEDCHQQFKEMG